MKSTTFSRLSIMVAALGAMAATAAAADETIRLKAADFARSHVYNWPRNQFGDMAARIRKFGNIGGYATPGEKGEGTRGFLEYDFTVPADGWYRVGAEPVTGRFGNMEISLDGKLYYPRPAPRENDAQTLGVFPLAKGKHTLRLEVRGLYDPFPKLTGFTFAPAAPEHRLRVETALPFVNEIVAAKGTGLPFTVAYSDRPQGVKFRIRALDKKTGATAFERSFDLPATEKLRTAKCVLTVPREGVFLLRYDADGKELGPKQGVRYELCAIDPTPVAPAAAEPAATRLREIDCVREAPDYAQGPHRIVTGPAGTYRETSNHSGWDKSDDHWIAWKFTVPEPDALYKFEFDYPDDAARASHFAIRQLAKGSYAKVIGQNSGREFRLSGKMLTATLYTWMFGKEGRLLVIPGGNRMPAAVAKMRISKVDGNRLLPLTAARPGNRGLQYFYEEASSVVGTFTGEPFEPRYTPPARMMKAFDRYCSQSAFMGATGHLYTHEIYGGGFWPSRFQPCRNTRPFVADQVAKLLLYAQKYGQDCMFDFHAVPMEFHPAEGELADPANRLLDASGSDKAWNDLWFMINPLHPDTAKWRLGAVVDFARRYKDYPNFKGIRLRHMGWQNSGWCNFHDLNRGYDDLTVGRFQTETGIAVPGDAGDPRRFGRRANFLRGPKRKEWMEWRARKVLEIYQEVRAALRKIRPDLDVVANCDGAGMERDYEAGIDADLLKKHGFQVSFRTHTGRNPSSSAPGNPDARRRESLKIFMQPSDPAAASPALMLWLPYYEGPSVAPNQAIGLPKDPRNWWGYAAWPAGRNELEFWALGLGRHDVGRFLTGTIGYGFGTPLMREFLREFDALPAARFETLRRDPVAVRRHGKWFYAVNTLPVPVRVKIRLAAGGGRAPRAADGTVCDVSDFELKPFELRSFTGENPAVSAEVKVPESYRDELRAIANPVLAAAKNRASLGPIAEKIAAALRNNELCELRLLLEIHRPEIEKEGVTLPNLYRSGAPEIPAGALIEPLSAPGVEKIAARTVFPDWKDETLWRGTALRYDFTLNADGMVQPVIAHAGGDAFGGIEVRVDGVPVTALENFGGKPYFSEVAAPLAFPLTAGKHQLELRSTNGKPLAVLYVLPQYRMRPVPCRYFRRGPVHTTGATWKTIRTELAKPLPEDSDRTRANWEPVPPHPDRDNHVVALGGGRDGNIRYALTWIYSPRGRRVEFQVGADYSWNFVLNGQTVAAAESQTTSGVARPDGRRYAVELKRGWNEVLFKVASGMSNHCLWLSVSDPGDLRFSENRGLK